MNVDVSVKTRWIEFLYCECNKACKINEYWSCEKRLIGKLALALEDEILNTTEVSRNGKKVTCKKKIIVLFTHDFIVNYMVLIISYHFYFLLLLLYKGLDKRGIRIFILLLNE